MSRAAVELDFLGMEKQSCAKSSCGQPLSQRKNVRGLQRAMSKIDPEVLRTVFAGRGLLEGSVDKSVSPRAEGFINRQISAAPATPPSTPVPSVQCSPAHGSPASLFPLTLSNHSSRPATEKANEATPLTIFYNGAVAVFNVSQDKAKNILKLAEKAKRGGPEAAGQSFHAASNNGDQLLEDLALDLPIARKLSLMRFLEKRRDRQVSLSPYAKSPMGPAMAVQS